MGNVMKKVVIFSLAIVLTACSGGGGGAGGPSGGGGSGGNLGPLYPNSRNSIYQLNSDSAKAGQVTYFTITVKDQNSTDFSLSTKWKVAVQISCPSCQTDSSPTAAKISSVGNIYQYKFTPGESNDYFIEVNFTPNYSGFSTDFPSGIDPDELYALALSVPAWSVCSQTPDPSLHGLRGNQIIAGVSRLAICSASDLALVGQDSFFLDKDLYLVNDIDLQSYYQNSGSEFSIGNDCSDLGNCETFSGSFYGNLKTVSNFKRTNGLGLFGIIEGSLVDTTRGKIEYLTLSNSVQSGVSGGGVAYGMRSQAKLIGVHDVGSSISGTDTVGGLVGLAADAYVVNSSSSSSVVSNNIVGGLVGFTSTDSPSYGFSRISASWFSGNAKVQSYTPVLGGGYAGGLVGKSDLKLEIYNSYLTGQVTSESIAGGLVGRLYGTINTSYSSGSVVGQVVAGGIVGETDPGFSNTINKSFNNSIVSGAGFNGAVGGSCNSLISDKILLNGVSSECGTQSGYSSTNVQATSYSTVPELAQGIQPILAGWAWDVTVWSFSQNNLPVIH